MAEENIEVGLKADTRSFVKSFNDASTAVKNVAGAARFVENSFNRLEAAATAKIQKMTKAIAGLTISTGATAVAGLAAFSKFEAGMKNVSTVADTTVMSLDQLSSEIRKMATVGGLPKTVDDLADGLYEVSSSGFQGAEGLDVLQRSAEFAVAGLTDTQTAVKGVTSILNAYGMDASKAADVTNILFKAVEVGQMSAGDFISQVGDWSAVAASLGVSVESAAAALASLTRGGMPATAAATAFSGVLRQLIKPTEEMGKAYKRLGFESGKSAVEQYGLVEVMNKLWEASGKNEATFAQMFQDVEGFRGALTLVTTQSQVFADTQDEMLDKFQTNGTVSRAMAKQMEGLGMQFQLLKNNIREMAINMGALLAGPAKGGLRFLNGFLEIINGLPQPLRNAVSILQLAAPAIAMATVALGGMALKTFLVSKALTQLTKSRMLGAWAASVVKAGGPMRYLVQQVMTFTGASNAMRLSMLRTAAGAAAMGVAMGGAAYLVFEMITAFSKARSEAKALASSLDVLANGQVVDSVASATEAMEKYRYAIQDLGNIDTRGDFWKSGLFALQTITPFTENTLLNGQMAREEIEKLIAEMNRLQSVVRSLSGPTWMTADEIMNALSALAQEGSVDIDLLISKWNEWNELANKERSAEGLTTGEAAKFEELNGYLDEVTTLLVEYEEIVERTALAQNEMSVSAGNLELALMKIGDKASTAADRLDAYNTILDETLGKTMSTRDKQAAFGESLREALDVFTEVGFALDPFTESGAQVQEVLSNVAETAQAMADEVYRQTDSIDQANIAMASYVQGLIFVAEQANWSNEQIKMMIDAMGLTPEVVQTLVTLPGGSEALAKLFELNNGLNVIDGRIVNVGVRIGVSVASVRQMGSADSIERWTQNTAPQQTVNNAIQDMINGINNSFTGWSPSGGSSGGGGGGGGSSAASTAPKWTMSPQLRKVVEDTIARNVDVVLEGIGDVAYVKEQADAFKTYYAVKYLAKGTNKLSASIYKAAEMKGEDPGDAMLDLAEYYRRAVAILGKEQAKLSLNLYNSLDAYKNFVEELEKAQAEARAIEDWKYNEGKMSDSAYLKVLRDRIKGLKKFSEEWREIKSQINDIEEKILEETKQKQEEALEDEKRNFERQVRLGQRTIKQYLSYLRQRLTAYERYSDEWWAITDEIDAIEQASADSAKEWANNIADAIKDAFESVVSPIEQATSLVSAFGDQSNVTFGQVQGFYTNMQEGVKRWVDAIRTLKSRGLNAKTLNELISAGPQSLGFAESLVDMGQDGIGFINDSVRDITGLTNAFGSEIASGMVGSAVQNQTNYNLQVGEVTLTFDPSGTTLTIADVNNAISAAFQEFSKSLTNSTR